VSAPPVEKPLRLGEVIAEAVRIYGERLWAAVGIGLVSAGSFVVASVLPAAAAILVVAVVFTACFAAAARVATGDRFVESWARVGLRVPVVLVLTLVVSVPFAIGIFIRAGDPLAGVVFLLFAVSWLVFMGFSIPAAMLEETSERESWFGTIARGLRRSIVLARADFFHALGVAAALVLIYGLVGPFLASALVGFAENTVPVAFLLAQVVLAPFFFLGLVVLYFEQRARQTARAVSSRGHEEDAPASSTRRRRFP
jgi:hypothetical protein